MVYYAFSWMVYCPFNNGSLQDHIHCGGQRLHIQNGVRLKVEGGEGTSKYPKEILTEDENYHDTQHIKGIF